MSNPWHLPTVLHYALAMKPKRILDIGVGMGTYGFMMRQFTDIAVEGIDRNKWQITIDGVEVFPDYKNPVWDYAYNSIQMGDIRNLIDNLNNYDVVICADVLEHFPIDESKHLMQQLLKTGKILIATTPAGYYPQGAWGGNSAETHHCTLVAQDFPDLIAVKKTGETNCFVCSSDQACQAALRLATDTCPTFHSSYLTLRARIIRKLRRLQSS